jgi:hypothetical protein
LRAIEGGIERAKLKLRGEINMGYDSTIDTKLHISRVQVLLSEMIKALKFRARNHDKSKLESPEKEVFDEYTPKLKASTYGSDEYKEFLKGMDVALKHHYENNRHHPEHFENSIRDMTLIDLIEMLCDWKAATERHGNGDIVKSLEINRCRFGISNQLTQILENTCKAMGWTG